VFEQFKVSPNSVQINPDGTFTFLGNSRHKKTFISSPESIFFGQGTNIPGNSSFTVGSGGTAWTMERAFSAFIGTGSAIEEITGSIALPRGIDTSSGLNVRIYWKKTSSATGNVQWKLAYVVAGAKNVPVTNGSSIPTAPRATSDSLTALEVKTIETSPTGTGLTANDEVLSDFTTEMKIDGKYEGDTLFMRLYRDPADADDTYAADAVMVGFEVSGVFWTLGEKL
jgi:hypothetical protein